MISFNKKTNTFTLETPSSVYIISIIKGFPAHVYYGKKIGKDDVTYLARSMEFGFSDTMPEREAHSFYDFFPTELPFDGLGDFRSSSIAVSSNEGFNGILPEYQDYRITKGAPDLEGLPHVFGKTSECQTLEIILKDKILDVEVSLFYTVFKDTDAIVRSSKITNRSGKAVSVKKALSASFDMDNRNYDVITLHGSWARERHIDRRPVHKGMQCVSSVRGETSHQEHPFLAVLDHNADYQSGEVYGLNFIYSGNFFAGVQNNQFDSLRIQIGINPENFSWKLEPGASFQTPQAVLVYSSEGLNRMSHSFHDLYRNHLIRSPYKNKQRPVLINNWEATYFDFNTEKLLDIAREAKKDGIEMLVMDDGWFGKRNSDNCSLGDWVVNEEKLPGGLKHLVDEVNKIGLKFGIWMEPEMISPDSDIFRQHPDWAIQIPGRVPGMSRQQLVLDLTRSDVLEYAYGCVKKILKSANIEYLKWDMNRQLSDIGSSVIPGEQIGEFFHRYVLAVYKMQEMLVKDFPKLLIENCSGGGARFDPGMLYYSPQIWCSDDTDAVERLAIQEGTALCYPFSAMGAHVSVCPNHAVGRVTPFKTRGYVALSGTFGYELDITKLPAEERSLVPGQIALYKRFNSIIRDGDYYRIASWSENGEYDAWASVSKDKSKALLTFVQVLNHPNYKSRIIKVPGLNPEKKYTVSYPDENGVKDEVLSGLTIMNAGIKITRDWGDFKGKIVYIEEKE